VPTTKAFRRRFAPVKSRPERRDRPAAHGAARAGRGPAAAG
jgi:hypothetical protein